MKKEKRERKRKDNEKFGPALKKIREFLYFEAGDTDKLTITRVEAIDRYLQYTGNLHVRHNKMEFVQGEYDRMAEPMFNRTRRRREI